MTAVNLKGANLSIVPEDAFIKVKLDVDKSTFLHKTGSIATSLHLRQTFDILAHKFMLINKYNIILLKYCNLNLNPETN